MTTTTHPHHVHGIGATETRRRIWAIVGGSSGNLVEWYDFYVYSFTALYFASEFFPAGDQTSQLLNAAGVFAAGFLMRPVGSWFFGRVADKHGRRISMMIAVIMMCGGSLMVALLPTYASIGMAAPLLLLVARLLQGLSVGGEYGTSATYMSEVAVHQHRGFYASFQYVTLIGGQLLAVLVLVVLQQYLSNAELKQWGWRIPFAIGALAAVIAFFLRRSLAETTSDAVRHQQDGGSLIFYTFTTYMQKYLVNTAGMDARTASAVMTAVLFCYMLMQPVFGAFSDKIGRRNSMLCFGVVTVLGTVPILSALSHATDPYVAFGLVILALAGVSFYTSISGLVKAELFPMHVRALGVGLSYAIANALFGGSAEYVALEFKSRGFESMFFWYVTVMCAVALIAAILMPDTRRRGQLTEDEAKMMET